MSAARSLPHPVRIAPPDLSRWAGSSSGADYVHELDSGRHGADVLVTALVHGNEYAGALAVDALLRKGLKPRRGRVTFAFCNVAAFARFDPRDPDASRFVDEDFNRVWSADRLDGAATSVELRRAREIRPFVDRATHLLDLHSMHEPGPPLLMTGPLQRNIACARELGTCDRVVADEGHSDGVRMRDYGRFADPAGSRVALLLEAGQHWEAATVQVARNVLMRFLVLTGALDREDAPLGWLLPDAVPPEPVAVTHRVVARSMNFRFTRNLVGGEIIARAGTPIADDDGRPVLTPYDDCVVVMPSTRQLRPGVTVVRLGRAIPA
ncbi:MAG: succinylglutamate desuccinylase [Ramlibacter sp.]